MTILDSKPSLSVSNIKQMPRHPAHRNTDLQLLDACTASGPWLDGRMSTTDRLGLHHRATSRSFLEGGAVRLGTPRAVWV